MKPSNNDAAPSLVADQPDYVNSSLRKKANLMRQSRSPAKHRPSLTPSDVGTHGGRVYTHNDVSTKINAVNTASPSMAVSVQSRNDKTQPFQGGQTAAPSALSNRSTVFRNNKTLNFTQSNSHTMIEEDESSEYLHEESTPAAQLRIVSHGHAGAVNFKPAGSSVIRQGVNAQDVHDARNLTTFQTRFKNAAIALQTNPVNNSIQKPVSVSAPTGISWDNIMENNTTVTGNSRAASTYDHRGQTHKRGEYEKFDDSSSVGTDILRDNARVTYPKQTNVSGTKRRDLVKRDVTNTMVVGKYGSTGSHNHIDTAPHSSSVLQKFTSTSSKSTDNHQLHTSSTTATSKNAFDANNSKRLDTEATHDHFLNRRNFNQGDIKTAPFVIKASLNDARKTNVSNLRNDYKSKLPSDTRTGKTESMGVTLSTQNNWKKVAESSVNSTVIYVDERKDVVDLDEAPCNDEIRYNPSSNRNHSTQRVNHSYGPAFHSQSVLESTHTSKGSKLAPMETSSNDNHLRSHNIFQERNSLSEDVLKRNNNRYSSESTSLPANNIKGFRGFIDKTKGTPALADYDSDSVVTASTTTDLQDDRVRGPFISPGQQGKSPERYNNTTSNASVFRTKQSNQITSNSLPILNPTGKLQHMTDSVQGSDGMNFARIGNTLSAIVSTPEAFQKRMVHAETFSDSDSLLERKSNVNDLAFNGEVPDFNNEYEASSHSDFSAYLVDPIQVQALVRKYRKISDGLVERGHDPVIQEDAKKAFALFEMRSRIMETDIERGLGRCGGTTVVDDMVVTEFYKEMYRVRDAVIVSKAWRDGASPKDAFTAMTLTRKAYIYSVKKPRRTRSPVANKAGLSSTSFSHSKNSFSWIWEEVLWVDDTDFTLLRCPSLGPRLMRGSEIFTIGDCQSILLKLTHERCEQLRQELNEAATLQLYAKEMMKEEAEFNDMLGVEGMMTDLEMQYLSTTEQVKCISKQLVLAEKAFTMVKERVERLVHKYEHILERIDQNGEVLSSNEDNESLEQEEVYLSEDEVNERGRLERRAERAELKAELAAREALMLTLTVEKTKQEAESIRMEKEQEILELHKRLDDLEKKSAFLSREYESKLSLKILEKAKFLTQTGNKEPQALSVHSIDDDASAAKERIKAKFRNRSAQKGNSTPQQGHTETESNRPTRNSFHQRLEFYERSLRSIEKP